MNEIISALIMDEWILNYMDAGDSPYDPEPDLCASEPPPAASRQAAGDSPAYLGNLSASADKPFSRVSRPLNHHDLRYHQEEGLGPRQPLPVKQQANIRDMFLTQEQVRGLKGLGFSPTLHCVACLFQLPVKQQGGTCF
jgi:hypothetical protein